MRYLMVLVLSLSISSQAFCSPSDPMEPGLSKDGLYEVSGRSWGKAREFGEQIERGELPGRTNAAIDALVRFGAYKLKRNGYKTKAKQLVEQWEGKYSQYLAVNAYGVYDLGDHAPLSKWLADKTAMLELLLGTEVMKLTRLYDLKVINYGLPMVFRCLDHVDEVEYGKHFVPLSGVVIYWTSFFVCVGGTWGTGFMFCGPLAMGAEFITTKWIAPKLNHKVWTWACKPASPIVNVPDNGLPVPEYVPN